MKSKALLALALLGVLIVTAAPCAVFAQGPEGGVTFSREQLDQMLAPVALYPDSLLAQILIAATYPDQVMDADQWLHANPGLRGRALNAELDRMRWDLSIKALVPFPAVLDMLAQQPDWAQRLGEAFMAQQADVMDSVQRLRRKAQEAGNLRTTPQQRVVVTDDYVEIQPVDPDMVYIPRYDPAVVYGSWWWPSYPPYAYYPVWPGPVIGFAPVVGAFGFWGGITVGPAWGWGWGSWGWGGGNVFLNVNRNININTTNVTVINSWHNNFRYANAHNLAVAGRVGSPTIRTRALGTSRVNPAALQGHIQTGRITHGQLVTRTGARPGMAGAAAGRHPGYGNNGFGAPGKMNAPGQHPGYGKNGYGAPGKMNAPGQHPGYGKNGFGAPGKMNTPGQHPGYRNNGFGAPGKMNAPGQHPGRPSANQVMQELHGGKTGAGGSQGRGGYGNTSHGVSRGSYGGANRGGYGQQHNSGYRGGYGNTSHGVSQGSYGGANRGGYGQHNNAPHGGYGGAAPRGGFAAPHNNFGGAPRGAPHGGVGAPHGGVGQNQKKK